MVRSHMAAGFARLESPVASRRLTNAVAAVLALAALSICLCVGLTLATLSVSTVTPLVG